MNRTTSALVLSWLLATATIGGTISGTVLDHVSGVPVAGAVVRVIGIEVTATTAADGGFTISFPDATPITLAVSRPGYDVLRLRALPGQLSPLRLELVPLLSIADRVEVTATRAREGADAASFTNIPQEQVKDAYWGQDPAILLSQVAPGFFAYSDSGNGIGYSYFTVRGFSQARSRVTLNGAPLNDAESGELFFIDLADFLGTAGGIQLRRGVFGLSGIGGALDITTESPSMTPSATLEGMAGSFGTSRASAVFSSGIIDGTWALSARYSKVSTDGYRDQSWVDQWNYYLSMARFGERSRLRIVLFGGPEQTHLAYEGIPKSVLEGGLTGDRDRDRRTNPITWAGEIDSFTQPHYQLLHELDLGHDTELEETFYAFQGEGYYEQLRTDRSLADYGLPPVVLPDGTVVTTTDLVRRRNVGEWDYGWVPTLSHRHGKWTVTLSGEARFHEARHVGEVRWAQLYPADVPPDHRYYDYGVDKKSSALAVNVAYKATSRLTLTAGLEEVRHAYTMRDDKINGVAFTERYGFTLPRAGALLALGEGADAYASVARGMREPGFRQIYDPEDPYGERVHLDPEDVWDWETGISLRRGTWRARANLFYMQFANEIVYAGALDDNGVPVYGNGARSLHRGLEVDATWDPSPELGVDGALTMSRNTFTQYHEQWDPQTTVVYDGNSIAGYPEEMAQLTLRTSSGPFSASLSGRYVGSFFVDNTEDNRRDPAAREAAGYVHRVNDAYTVFDLAARVALPERALRSLGLSATTIELRVNNLLNARYTAFGYMDAEPLYIPAATRGAYLGLKVGL